MGIFMGGFEGTKGFAGLRDDLAGRSSNQHSDELHGGGIACHSKVAGRTADLKGSLSFAAYTVQFVPHSTYCSVGLLVRVVCLKELGYHAVT